MKQLIFSIFVFLSSCSHFIEKIEENSTSKTSSTPSDSLDIVFSHNISGETHPCGCRQFPLGGLPQVYGLFQTLKTNHQVLYVDTGDTFFPSSNIPKSMHSSLSFAANNLAQGLDMLGLQYFVPGDQDFALGIDFLKNLANTLQFKFLISNLKDENLIKHEKIAVLKINKATLFLIGLVNPEAINTVENELFKNVNESMAELSLELKNLGYDASNSHHRLIILSHAGIDLDEKLAEKFPNIDWIIGSHSQSFLRFSRDVGNVKLVQTLSKNHYVGDISIDLGGKKEKDTYALHEIRDELEKKANPNPMRAFIDNHKTKMSELQIEEQNKMVKSNDNQFSASSKRIKTVKSCLECHKPQVEFWQSTPHSLAFATLMNTKEQNNLQCVKCHSVGLGDPRGFSAVKNIISFKDHAIIDYWNKAHDLSSNIKSIRKLSPKEISSISKKWMELDTKSGIKLNYANVQCLNCHDKHEEHPFNVEINTGGTERFTQIKNKCLSCHTPEQAPEWYSKNEKGLSQVLNEKIFNQNYKKMSCPALQ